jgi:DnaJ-class molecular chaperone
MQCLWWREGSELKKKEKIKDKYSAGVDNNQVIKVKGKGDGRQERW